jgi:hypothetical protein
VVGYSGARTTGFLNTFGSSATYSGTTTYTPLYGVTGYVSVVTVDRVHSRVAMMRVFRVAHGPNAAPVFEVTGTSQGYCGMLASVAPAIIQGMLEDFPKPGTRRTVGNLQDQC